jgi:biotin synthase
MDWLALADRVLLGEEITNEEAEAILDCPDDELLLLMQGAYRIRKKYYGNKVKLNMIINAKSGLCPENCGYCSQSAVSSAPVQTYKMVSKETLLRGAEQAYQSKVGTYCIVASGRSPSEKEIDTVVSAVKEIKEKYGLKICACLGILKPEQALRLKEAGVYR